MSVTEYVVVANVIGDDLLLPGGDRRTGILGGAGTYAVAGMRIWTEGVGIVSGVGEDFETLYGAWFTQNGIDQQGLRIRGKNTPRSWVNYQSDDDRTEVPQLGPEHFQQMEPTIADIPDAYHTARGIYIFRDTNETFWEDMFAYQTSHYPTIIWEIHAGATLATNWGAVAEILSGIDLFSINLAEAQALCQLSDPIAITEKLLATGVAGVALRLGSEGTIVADQSGCWRLPIYPLAVVDVTGAGNAFTGGFLVGYCTSDADIVRAGQYGAVAASFMLEQFGPPQHITTHLQQDARQRLACVSGVHDG